MPDTTDNHQLQKFSDGEENWEHRTDMQTIEERLVVRDTETNRTNYTPHANATYVATDTGAVYDGDGTNWNAATRSYSSLEAESVSGGVTSTAIANFEGDNLSVDGSGNLNASGGSGGGLPEYGWAFYVYNDAGTITVLDNTGSTATTSSSTQTALQYANDNLPADGGTIILGPDSFNDDGQVALTSAGATVKMVDGGKMVSQGGHTTFSIEADDVRIENVEWDGAGVGKSFIDGLVDTELFGIEIVGCDLYNYAEGGMFLRAFSDLLVTENYVHDADQYGIHYNPAGTVTPADATFSNNRVKNLTYNGITAYSDANHVTIQGNTLLNCGHSAIAASTSTNVTITGNTVRDVTAASEAGIEVEFKGSHGSTPAKNVTVSGNSVDNCTWGIFTGDRDGTGDIPQHVVITSNTITNSTTGIYLREGDMLGVANNTLFGNTTHIDEGSSTNVFRSNNVIEGTVP